MNAASERNAPRLAHVERRASWPEADRIEAIERRVDRQDDTFGKVTDKLDEISSTLNSLVRIEERQVAATDVISNMARGAADRETRLRALEIAVPENIGKRLNVLEAAQPGLLELRKFLVAGVVAGLGMIGAAVVHLVLKSPP